MNYSLKLRIVSILFIIFVLILLDFVQAQNAIKSYIRECSSQIESIDPDSIDFSDLEPLKKAIGNAQIVMLGEQDHGDAPTFLAKIRLIKYLHENLGFNVLAFETDFAGLTFGWDRVNKSNCDSIMKNTIYPHWTYCNTFQRLIQNYIPSRINSNPKLRLAGIDSQISIGSIIAGLDSTLRAEKISITSLKNYSSQLLPEITAGCPTQPDVGRTKRCIDYLVSAKNELAERSSMDDFWVKIIDNILTYHRSNFEQMKFADLKNLRDSQMAMNLDWLKRAKFSNEKIIVWAHNHHISKYSGHYPTSYFNGEKTMGTIFTSIPGNEAKTYIIAFTSYKGVYGRMFPPQKFKVPKPKSDSYENWIPKQIAYAFTDFTTFNKQNPDFNLIFNMSGSIANNQYHRNYEAKWNKVFDGVFFIREMWRCENVYK